MKFIWESSVSSQCLSIFEPSWEFTEVPANWKLASGVLVLEKGKKDSPRKYKPVSLTAVFGKSMEIIILGGI